MSAGQAKNYAPTITSLKDDSAVTSKFCIVKNNKCYDFSLKLTLLDKKNIFIYIFFKPSVMIFNVNNPVDSNNHI